MNLLIAWVLLTLPVVFFSTALMVAITYISSKAGEDDDLKVLTAFLILLIWWGIYFLII